MKIESSQTSREKEIEKILSQARDKIAQDLNIIDKNSPAAKITCAHLVGNVL